ENAGPRKPLQSTPNAAGRVFEVTAVAQPNGLNIKVNGQERLGRADVWTTSYWQLHDPKRANQPVPLLDADTGRDLNGHLQHFGAGPLSVGGQVVHCTRYRFTGGPPPAGGRVGGSSRPGRPEVVGGGEHTNAELVVTTRRAGR